jgi:hypothetical protein
MNSLRVQQMRHGRVAQPLRALSWHFGCNPSHWRHFVKAVARFAWCVAIFVLVAYALFTPRVVTSSQRAAPAVAPTSAVTDGPVERRARQGAADGAVDLYGNEVSDAIATYSLDPAGGLYELHSPQTELPRLASPKS